MAHEAAGQYDERAYAGYYLPDTNSHASGSTHLYADAQRDSSHDAENDGDPDQSFPDSAKSSAKKGKKRKEPTAKERRSPDEDDDDDASGPKKKRIKTPRACDSCRRKKIRSVSPASAPCTPAIDRNSGIFYQILADIDFSTKSCDAIGDSEPPSCVHCRSQKVCTSYSTSFQIRLNRF